MKVSNQLSKLWVGILFLVLFSIGCQRSPEARSAAYIATGKNLLQKHDPGRAILQFRNAVQVTPRNAEAHYQLGLAYLAADDVLRGAAALRRALSLDPKHPGVQLRLAQLMTSVDDPDTLKDTVQRLEALLRDSPDNPEALHALGLTELKLGEPQDAMQHLERAFTIAPGLWTLATTLAEAKIQQKDMQGAENVLKQACDKAPKSANAHVMLGRFYSLQKSFAKSQEEYQRALAIDSKNAAALISLATLQRETGRSQDAAQTLKQLTGLPLKEYQSLYGVFLFEQGRREEAIREFERLSRQDPDDRLARTRLVAAYQAVNRVPDAEKLLNEVLKAHPKDLDALLQRGELRLAAKKYAEAEADLLSVLHAKPDSPEAHYAVAKLHQTRNRPLMYRQELNEVLRLNPGLLPVRVELAK
jgi:tetratricopeptide (TPR) repeat protein